MTTDRALRIAGSVLSVAAPTLFVVSLLPASLLIDTTTAGGDMASHNYAAAWLQRLLLEEGRLTGWVPGNYAGFPLFQMYFPLPFVVMVLASPLVGLNVAFKLVSVVGLVMLPLAAWLLVRKLRVPSPGPALGASGVLLFLLQDGNTMWGGNVASTMAGEFSYSISLLLALLWFGVYERSMRSAGGAAVGAVVVALLALTHAYTVLWVAATAGLVVLLRSPSVSAVLKYVVVFLWGGALCAFWLLPLVGYAPWTTAYRHLWVMGSVAEVVPRSLWPVLVVVVLCPPLIRRRGVEDWRVYLQSTGLLYAGAATAALAYGAAPSFGIVDVRFLPFLQLSLCLLAAAGAGHVVSRWPAPALAVPVVFLGSVLLVHGEAERMAGWARWNYDGFERKPLWPVYRDMAAFLRGGVADPRVAYEHSPDHEVLGTTRAFENLPLFAGRSTLEGVNMQASVTSPFVFYVQSEISETMSCPFSEWGCSRPNLPMAVEHLRMMNVSDLIVRSDTIKAAAAAEPGLTRRAGFGPYDVFTLTQPAAGYVVALEVTPFPLMTADWKVDGYRWFKYATSHDAVPVYVRTAAEADRFAASVSASQSALQSAAGRAMSEHIEAERIVATGVQPGVPLLIKVSFHPRWRASSGEPVWLAGPGFMIVVPTTERMELVYGPSALTRAAQFVTFAAVGLLAVVIVGPRRIGARRLWGASDEVAAHGRLRLAMTVSGVSVAVVGLALGMSARRQDPDAIYRAGQRQLDAGDRQGAVRAFQRARELAPLSNTAIHSTYFEAIALYRAEEWAAAGRVFQQLVDQFPEAHAAAESLYHVGLCAAAVGDHQRARAAFEETRRRFPDTYWAGVASERLADVAGGS